MMNMNRCMIQQLIRQQQKKNHYHNNHYYCLSLSSLVLKSSSSSLSIHLRVLPTKTCTNTTNGSHNKLSNRQQRRCYSISQYQQQQQPEQVSQPSQPLEPLEPLEQQKQLQQQTKSMNNLNEQQNYYNPNWTIESILDNARIFRFGQHPYGSRQYVLMMEVQLSDEQVQLQQQQQQKQNSTNTMNTNDNKKLVKIASISAHKNIIFGAKVYWQQQIQKPNNQSISSTVTQLNSTSTSTSMNILCKPLLQLAIQDAIRTGEQPQAVSTINGYCSWIQQQQHANNLSTDSTTGSTLRYKQLQKLNNFCTLLQESSNQSVLLLTPSLPPVDYSMKKQLEYIKQKADSKEQKEHNKKNKKRQQQTENKNSGTSTTSEVVTTNATSDLMNTDITTTTNTTSSSTLLSNADDDDDDDISSTTTTETDTSMDIDIDIDIADLWCLYAKEYVRESKNSGTGTAIASGGDGDGAATTSTTSTTTANTNHDTTSTNTIFSDECNLYWSIDNSELIDIDILSTNEQQRNIQYTKSSGGIMARFFFL